MDRTGMSVTAVDAGSSNGHSKSYTDDMRRLLVELAQVMSMEEILKALWDQVAKPVLERIVAVDVPEAAGEEKSKPRALLIPVGLSFYRVWIWI